MSTTFILFYISTIIIALLGLAGVVVLINGLATQNKKLMWRGSILTGLTFVLIISGVFCGAHKCYRVCQKNCMNKEMNCRHMDFDHCMMKCNSMMMMDSTFSGDSCKMMIEKEVMNDKMQCDPSKCDPSKCKPDCPHKK
ncbi:MAG: hypothetical protein V1904_12450 [Bacteroidota bacterium]